MKVSARQDYSTLFSSFNNSTIKAGGVSDLAGLVSDYNTIKNGSYNKLVKAYYKKMDSEGNTTSKASGKSSNDTTEYPWDTSKLTAKSKSEASKEYSKISSDASKLKESVAALSEDAKTDLFKETDGKVDREKIDSAVTTFVDNYNSLVKSAGSASSDSVKSKVDMMTGLSTNYFKKLSNVGITLQENGTLSLDKDKLSAAKTDDIKSLFNGSNTFGDRVDSYAKLIDTSAAGAAKSASTYNASALSNASYDSLFSSFV